FDDPAIPAALRRIPIPPFRNGSATACDARTRPVSRSRRSAHLYTSPTTFQRSLIQRSEFQRRHPEFAQLRQRTGGMYEAPARSNLNQHTFRNPPGSTPPSTWLIAV